MIMQWQGQDTDTTHIIKCFHKDEQCIRWQNDVFTKLPNRYFTFVFVLVKVNKLTAKRINGCGC